MTAAGLLGALATASCGAYGVTVDQTIVFWNGAAERILGHTSREVLGRRCNEVVGGLAQGALTPQCLKGCPSIRYLRSGLVPATSRLRVLCSTGERKWVNVTSMVVAGILRDAPLLVHLFNEEGEAEDFTESQATLRESLIAGGADILLHSPPNPGPPPLTQTLTEREQEVLRLVALGWDTPRIAGELGISRHTVRNHIRNLRQKLKANSKLEAVITGIRLGILPVSKLSP
ncbi:MAG: PAS and helix-turn-helix domain-containing protein [Chloroflexi bacterium]|nr:PAS and helix-turn-helix domain-containing protein [Chloroflexota bacterium]